MRMENSLNTHQGLAPSIYQEVNKKEFVVRGRKPTTDKILAAVDEQLGMEYEMTDLDKIPVSAFCASEAPCAYFGAEMNRLKAMFDEMRNDLYDTAHKYLEITPIGVKITVGDLSIVIMRCMIDLMQSTTLYQFVIAIVSFYKDLMGKSYMAVIDEFGFYITECLSYCFDFVVKLPNVLDLPIQQDGVDIRFDSFIGNFRRVLNHYDRLVSSEFAQKVTLFLGLLTMSPFCIKNGITFESFGLDELLCKVRKQKITKMSNPSFMYNVLDISCYMAEKLQYIIINKDLHCIYMDDDEVRKFEEEYTFLKYYEKNMNLLPNHECTLDLYLKRVDALQGKLKDIQGFYKKDVSAQYMMRDYRLGLARMKYAVMDKLKVTIERPCPIGLMLYGPPGIGKSVLSDQILKICYDNAIYLKHFPDNHTYEKKFKYVLCPEDEFMSEFRINHEVVMMDDVDQYTQAIMEAKEGGLITKAISFVNEIPYVTPQAALEDKGKIPLLCEFVVGTTNSKSAGIPLAFRKQSGALRRFFFIDVVVKEEHRRNGTTALSSNHASDDYDLHDFRLRRYEPVGTEYQEVFFCPDVKTWRVGPSRYMSMKELAFILRDYVQLPHYTQSNLAKKTVEQFLDSRLCNLCGVTEALCDCPKHQSGIIFNPNSEYFADHISLIRVVRDSFLEILFFMYVGFQYLLYASIGYPLAWFKFDISWMYSLMNRTMIMPIDTHGILSMPVQRLQFLVHLLYIYNCKREMLDRGLKDLNVLTYTFAQHKKKIMLVTGLSVVYVSFKIFKKFFMVTSASLQSGEFIKPKPDENQAKDNPWKFHTTDISVVRGSSSNITAEDIHRVVSSNVCLLAFHIPGEGYSHFVNGLGLFSNYVIVPFHWINSIRPHFPCKVDILRSPVKNRISPNRYGVWIDETCVVLEDSSRDFVIMKHGGFGSLRDIRKFFALDETRLSGKLKGCCITRDLEGNLVTRALDAVRSNKFGALGKDGVRYFYDGYSGYANSPTSIGECGGPYILSAANGYVIAGLHIAGAVKDKLYEVHCTALNQELISFPENSWDAQLNSFNGIDLKETYITDASLAISPIVHPKCPSQMIEKGVGEIFGTLSLPRRKLKSTVMPTMFQKEVLEYFGMLECDYFSPKEISSREAIKLALEQSMNQPSFIPYDVETAVFSLTRIYLSVIHSNDLFIPNKPFDLDVGINGCDGVTYIDRLPVTTSGGFAHKGPKLRHLVSLVPNESHAVRYGFDDDLQHEYEKMLKHYSESDESYSIVWDFNLKDEPVSAQKIRDNKCRVFNAGPFTFNVLVRQYFLWCVPLFSGKYRHEFGMAIGANVLSEDWTLIYNWVTKHGKDRMIAGDYKAFDKNMPKEIMLAAFQVLFNIMNVYGWDPDDVLIARRLSSEIINGVYNADGTLMRLAGNPSGNCLTTIINSIANIMYIMIACIRIEARFPYSSEEDRIDYLRFFDYVSIVTYGDDNIMSSKYDWINHTSISNTLKEFGLEYTMADKTSASRPFIDISECDFLKRAFRPDVNIKGVVAAPLAEKSIVKSLTVCNKSDSINFEEQCAQILDSAMREYYQYGPDQYGIMNNFLSELAVHFCLRPWLPRQALPMYNELKEAQLSIHLGDSFKYGNLGLPRP